MNTPHPYSTNHPGRQTPRVEKISQNPKQNTISRHASRARSSRWYTVQITERESPSPAGRRRCSPTRIVRGRSRQKKKKRVKGGESLFENRVTDATNAMLCCETDSAVRQSRSSSPRHRQTEQNRTEQSQFHHITGPYTPWASTPRATPCHAQPSVPPGEAPSLSVLVPAESYSGGRNCRLSGDR